MPACDGIDDLRNGGTLSKSLPGYTERPAQLEMAHLVAESLDAKTHAVIEAGTGTGKSLGYLLPVVRSGKTAIISTANKALQEQLFYKDIPFVQKHVEEFDAALVKGYSNYLCLDRLKEYKTEGIQVYAQRPEFEEIEKAVDGHVWDGDFETPGSPIVPADIRKEVAGDSDRCSGPKCHFHEDCYIMKMKRRAEKAKVIVVNHTLLLIDARISGKLLPDHDVTVLDEAHHLEEEATSAFTTEVKDSSVAVLLRLNDVRARSKKETYEKIMQQDGALWRLLDGKLSHGKLVLTARVEEGLYLASSIAELARELEGQRPPDQAEHVKALYDKLIKRIENLAENLREVFSVSERTRYVYYLEVTQNGRHTFMSAKRAPLDVSHFLRDNLFSKGPVICTSATLATGGNLSYFKRRVGLDEASTAILPLVFDYQKQSLLYLPRALPEPPCNGAVSTDYQKAIAKEMLQLVQASKGRAFLLFSSKKMLDAVYALIADDIRASFPVLCQGEKPRAVLTSEFRETPGAVLFGLKSFWEGVDISGEALSLVVIDKLPFAPPDDPVHEARVNLMKEAGENWFGDYTLPQTILLLKQGVGRLIRTTLDRGVMAILDTRLYTKGYGKLVVSSLPPAKRSMQIQDVVRFFEGDKIPEHPSIRSTSTADGCIEQARQFYTQFCSRHGYALRLRPNDQIAVVVPEHVSDGDFERIAAQVCVQGQALLQVLQEHREDAAS